MRFMLVLALACGVPAFAQEPMSEAQRADYARLMRSYLETFRVLGRSRACGLNFDAEPHFRELARRHGADSEPVRIAGLAYKAAAENLMLSRDIDPTPPAPMPCDVVVYMRDLRLPDLQ